MQNCTGTTVQQIQCALAPVANNLGQGAKYVWAANFRQVIIEAAIMLLFAAVFFVVSVVGGVLAYRHLRKVAKLENASSYNWGREKTLHGAIGFPALGVSLVSTIVWISLLAAGLPQLLNPGYYTIARILRQVTG